MLVVENLALSHGPAPVLDRLDLALRPGEVTALCGPNGAGKSTLLRALFGAHPARAGRLALDGEPLRPHGRRAWQDRIGYMPQEAGVQGGLTALEIVLLGAVGHLSLRLGDAQLRAAAASLDRVGVLHLAQRRIETLSGGQRQLVFFAQVLLRRPRVLLLDEPVSALDLRHQILLLRRVREITRTGGMISVMVLHDLNLAAGFADRAVLIHRGRTWADGAPEDVFTSETLSAVYGVDARIHRGAGGGTWIEVVDGIGDEHEPA